MLHGRQEQDRVCQLDQRTVCVRAKLVPPSLSSGPGSHDAVQRAVPNQYPALNIQYRRDGVLSVQNNAPITECDIADLVPMKQMLYPILYPGSMKFQKDALRDRKLCVYWQKPMMYWEVLPLFENEVSENENEVIFTYQEPTFRFGECGVETHTFPQK